VISPNPYESPRIPSDPPRDRFHIKLLILFATLATLPPFVATLPFVWLSTQDFFLRFTYGWECHVAFKVTTTILYGSSWLWAACRVLGLLDD
jgi:hypothetical protein